MFKCVKMHVKMCENSSKGVKMYVQMCENVKGVKTLGGGVKLKV